jgi:hypothetical protein
MSRLHDRDGDWRSVQVRPLLRALAEVNLFAQFHLRAYLLQRMYIEVGTRLR